MIINLIQGDSECDWCGGDLELNEYENKARYIANEGILCGKCVEEYHRRIKAWAKFNRERSAV